MSTNEIKSIGARVVKIAKLPTFDVKKETPLPILILLGQFYTRVEDQEYFEIEQ